MLSDVQFEEVTSQWPEPLYGYLKSRYGAPTSLERLSGMSGGSGWRACFQGSCVIVKKPRHEREVYFYERVAPHLRAQGVSVPDLQWSAHYGDSAWMVVENIPAPLPRDRWIADPQLLAVLHNLHNVSTETAHELPEVFRPQWTEAMSITALSLLPAATAESVGTVLYRMQEAAQPLFASVCCISGDPNPANWGVREDASPVLYDWERFGLGTPALDLAITVPWLGNPATFRAVAVEYLSHSGANDQRSIERLAREIAVAKVWSVVEFLALDAARLVQTSREHIERLIAEFPAWVQSLVI